METDFTVWEGKTRVLSEEGKTSITSAEPVIGQMPRIVAQGRTYVEVPKFRIKATTLVIGLVIALFCFLGATPPLVFAIGVLVFIVLMDAVNIGTGND